MLEELCARRSQIPFAAQREEHKESSCTSQDHQDAFQWKRNQHASLHEHGLVRPAACHSMDGQGRKCISFVKGRANATGIMSRVRSVSWSVRLLVGIERGEQPRRST